LFTNWIFKFPLLRFTIIKSTSLVSIINSIKKLPILFQNKKFICHNKFLYTVIKFYEIFYFLLINYIASCFFSIQLFWPPFCYVSTAAQNVFSLNFLVLYVLKLPLNNFARNTQFWKAIKTGSQIKYSSVSIKHFK
jgi:hypothetical protein